MSRLPRWSLLVASLVGALGVVALVGVSWIDRADNICLKEAPTTGSGYTMAWN